MVRLEPMSWSVPNVSWPIWFWSWVKFVGGRFCFLLWAVGLDLGMLDCTSEADCIAYTRSRDDALIWCIICIGSGWVSIM